MLKITVKFNIKGILLEQADVEKLRYERLESALFEEINHLASIC